MADTQTTVEVVKNGVAEINKLAVGGVTPAAQQSKISDPAGGGTQDDEARTAINAIIDVLEAFGLTADS